jgi:hypothetical protein
MYPCVLISSLIGRIENLLYVILYTSFGIWPRDHYMSLQRLTLVHMSYFALGFPLLDITQYPEPLSQLLTFPLVGYHIISSGPSCTLRPCRYHHTSTEHPTRQLTRASIISQQAVTYRTRGGTCCPGMSTPKIQSIVDLSMTNYIT